MNAFIWLLLACLCAFNVTISTKSIRDEYSLRREHVARLCLIWLLPVIGALLVLFMLRANPENGSGTYSAEPEMGRHDSGFGGMNARGYIRSG